MDDGEEGAIEEGGGEEERNEEVGSVMESVEDVSRNGSQSRDGVGEGVVGGLRTGDQGTRGLREWRVGLRKCGSVGECAGVGCGE